MLSTLRRKYWKHDIWTIKKSFYDINRKKTGNELFQWH